MNYDTFLFIGHGTSEKFNSYDPGAVNGDIQEYNIAKQIVETALIYLKDSNLKIHVDENNFKDNDLSNNKYTFKCGLSVHINAGGGTGCECYVPLKEKYFNNDITLLNNLSTLLNYPNRGVKSREYSTGQTFSRSTGTTINGTDYYQEIRQAWQQGISLSLLEVGFIDSNDIFAILDNIDKIGYCIAVYISSICNKPIPTIPNNTGKYKVIIPELSFNESEELCILLSEIGYKNPTVEYYD